MHYDILIFGYVVLKGEEGGWTFLGRRGEKRVDKKMEFGYNNSCLFGRLAQLV